MQAQLDLEADLRIFEMYLANVDWSPPQFHANPDGENSAGVHERELSVAGAAELRAQQESELGLLQRPARG